MRRAFIFLVTVERAMIDELVHERVFMTESEAMEWATPFIERGFRVTRQRFRNDGSYSQVVPSAPTKRPDHRGEKT